MQACTSCLQHARGWSHEATKNVHNANKMTDIISYVHDPDLYEALSK